MRFGHPSEYGYKDICNNWVIDRWNPEEMMRLFVEMGARYFMAMGVHHDNFDCWDSKYQPWNSVRVGPGQRAVTVTPLPRDSSANASDNDSTYALLA